MDDYESLSHTKWECKYHVVFIPKFRRKTLYGELRQHLGEVFRNLAKQQRVLDRRRPYDAGSCAHVDIDPAKTCSVTSRRVYQRQECDTSGPDVRRQKAQLRRSALLGQRLLCIHGWA